MKLIKNLNNNSLKVIFVLLILIIGISASLIPIHFIAFILLGILGLFFAMHFIEYFLLTLILIRSSLDGIKNINISIGSANINPAGFLGIIIVLIGILYFFIKKEAIQTNKITRVFSFFIVFSLLGVLNSFLNFGLAGIIAIEEWIRLFSLFMLFLLIQNVVKSEKQIDKFLKIMFLSLPIPLIAGYLQIIIKPEATYFRTGMQRIFGTCIHPNHYALYLGLFLVIAIAFYFEQKNIHYGLLIPIILIPFIATFSLTGLIMLGIAITVLGLIRFKKVLAFSLPIIIILTLTIPPIQQRLLKLTNMDIVQEIKSGETSTSFSWRVYWWSNYLDEVKAKPFFGYGLHMTKLLDPRENKGGIIYAPHNDYLSVSVEMGLIGLLVHIFFYAIIGIWIWRSYKRLKKKKYKSFAVALFSIYIALISGSLVGNFITATVFQYYFWSSIGLLSVIRRLEDDNPDSVSKD